MGACEICEGVCTLAAIASAVRRAFDSELSTLPSEGRPRSRAMGDRARSRSRSPVRVAEGNRRETTAGEGDRRETTAGERDRRGTTAGETTAKAKIASQNRIYTTAVRPWQPSHRTAEIQTQPARESPGPLYAAQLVRRPVRRRVDRCAAAP